MGEDLLGGADGLGVMVFFFSGKRRSAVVKPALQFILAYSHTGNGLYGQVCKVMPGVLSKFIAFFHGKLYQAGLQQLLNVGTMPVLSDYSGDQLSTSCSVENSERIDAHRLDCGTVAFAATDIGPTR